MWIQSPNMGDLLAVKNPYTRLMTLRVSFHRKSSQSRCAVVSSSLQQHGSIYDFLFDTFTYAVLYDKTHRHTRFSVGEQFSQAACEDEENHCKQSVKSMQKPTYWYRFTDTDTSCFIIFVWMFFTCTSALQWGDIWCCGVQKSGHSDKIRVVVFFLKHNLIFATVIPPSSGISPPIHS